jgi:Uma2 family endonuclease
MRQKSARPPMKKPRGSVDDVDSNLTWDIARLFPAQGTWTDEDYLALIRVVDGFPLAELSCGRLEVLPMPTKTHQLILVYLFKMLEAFTQQHAPGLVLPSGMRLRLGKGKYRDPDVIYMKAEHEDRCHEEHCDGADLVMEIVSGDPKDRERDWEDKPREYARAGIPEYWIVDPDKQLIRVLTLRGKTYEVHGDFGPDARATSVLLPGFAVSVAEMLASGRR